MMLSGALLLFLGTLVCASPFLPSLPTEIVLSKHKHESSDKVRILPSSSRSAVIENYIQEGTNVFFKPQFVLSADKMPPQIQSLVAAIENDDCKTAYPLVTPVIVDEPLRVVEQEISGPITEIKQITEIKPTEILQEVHVPKPELVTIIEEVKPLVIPPAPVLPPMELPKLPTLLVDTPVVADVSVPPAPVLPALQLPELPLFEKEEFIAEIPCDPHVPTTTIVEVEKPEEIGVLAPIQVPVPPFGKALLEVRVDGVRVPFKHNPIANVIVEVDESKEVKVIPPGPVLPPMEKPKLPVLVESISLDTEVPCEPLVPVIPSFLEVEEPKVSFEETVFVENKMQNIPPAPVLAPLEMPKLPIIVEEKHSVELEKIKVPTLPPWFMSPIHNFNKIKDCGDDVVIETTLPKIQKDMLYERPVPYLVPVY